MQYAFAFLCRFFGHLPPISVVDPWGGGRICQRCGASLDTSVGSTK